MCVRGLFIRRQTQVSLSMGPFINDVCDLLGPNLFFVCGSVKIVLAVARQVCPDQLGSC